MNVVMSLGLLLVLSGVSIALFTQQGSEGVEGVRLIALLIGAGLLLLIPSKVVITLLLMLGNPSHKESK